jgi:hypothetical protein
MDFTEKLRLHGKAEEDLYFARLDKQLIEEMHNKQKHAHDAMHLQGQPEVPEAEEIHLRHRH